jgi:hypothetical protein
VPLHLGPAGTDAPEVLVYRFGEFILLFEVLRDSDSQSILGQRLL